MTVFLYISAALCGYLVACFNPAILISNAVYHQDIRTLGSKNPGFTNFKRVFGHKWAWCVFFLDIFKAAAVVGLFSFLFGYHLDARQFGAAYTGAFCMLGHAFPVFYGFKGGKGFLVCLSTMWVTDPRVGLISTALMVILLLTTKYMSLSTVTAMLVCPFLLILFKAPPSVICICAALSIFMTVRHRKNIKRLFNGTESKFYLFKKKDS